MNRKQRHKLLHRLLRLPLYPHEIAIVCGVRERTIIKDFEDIDSWTGAANPQKCFTGKERDSVCLDAILYQLKGLEREVQNAIARQLNFDLYLRADLLRQRFKPHEEQIEAAKLEIAGIEYT